MANRASALFPIGSTVTPRSDFPHVAWSQLTVLDKSEPTAEQKASRFEVKHGVRGIVLSTRQRKLVAHHKMSGWPVGPESVICVVFPNGVGWFEPDHLEPA